MVLNYCPAVSARQAGLLFITKAEFFLFACGFRKDPLPEGGYFTQFCLTVMTNQIKSIFTDQHIVKRADQTPRFYLTLVS